MKITRLDIPDLLLIEPKVYEDERGYFFESFNEMVFYKASGLQLNFVQDNESMSQEGVLRGLHLQVSPYAQGKLVRVVQGEVFDVAVDLRKASPYFGKWCGIKLSASNKKQLYIPPGFAHGFASLESQSIFQYKCTSPYHKESEVCIQWNDSDIGIDWPLKDPIVSDKDKSMAIKFLDFQSPF